MDKDRLLENQPAADLPPDQPAEGIDTWSPQPSRLYGEFDAAAAEGAAKPTVDPITEADTQMQQRQDLSGACSEQGNSPFLIAAHEVQHTGGQTKECDFAGIPASRQGQNES
jgi:hypothetical protein